MHSMCRKSNDKKHTDVESNLVVTKEEGQEDKLGDWG